MIDPLVEALAARGVVDLDRIGEASKARPAVVACISCGWEIPVGKSGPLPTGRCALCRDRINRPRRSRPTVCAGCGEPLPSVPSPRGRIRLWCSDPCRRRAAREKT